MKFSWMMKILVSAIFGIGMYAQAGTTLHFKTGQLNTEFQTLSVEKFQSVLQSNSTNFFVIQFKNRIGAKDKAALKQAGLKVHSYIPDDAYLVERSGSVGTLNMERIQALLPFAGNLKLSPKLAISDPLLKEKRIKLLIKVFAGKSLEGVQSQLAQLDGVKVQFAKGSDLGVVADYQSIQNIVGIDEVRWVGQYPELEFLHLDLQKMSQEVPVVLANSIDDLDGYESGTKVMNFEEAWQAGWTGKGQLIGFSDTGLDVGDIGKIHEDFQNQVEKGYAYGLFGFSWADPMGHGTHVAGSIAGNGSASSGVVKGGAYESRLIVGGMWSDILGTMIPPQDITKMFKEALADGAYIHTNSWGSPRSPGAYDQFAETVDQFMWDNPEMLLLFAAGNSGADVDKDGRVDRDSIGSPATAKNVLSVGASENLVTNGGIQAKVGELADQQGNPLYPSEPLSTDKISDNPDGVAVFSSRGPTDDGRIKPDVVAPGANILSVRSQKSGASELWGALNQDYVWSGGTSMSTPLVAGGAAVIRQYLSEDMQINSPSSALIKAILMQTSFDMYPGQFGEKGKSKGQELLELRPNIHQGFGRVDMKAATSLNKDFIVDSTTGVEAGASVDHEFTLNGKTSLQVTLVYTDAPGAPSAARALVNNIDLQILVNGQVVAESKDDVNNFEHLTLEEAEGDITVRVIGENIPTGRTGDSLPYALVITQDVAVKQISRSGDSETQESVANTEDDEKGLPNGLKNIIDGIIGG